MDIKAQHLEAVASWPIFKGMTNEERRKLLSIARPVQFARGDEVLTQGHPGRDFWIIVEGTCQVVRLADDVCRHDIILADLEPPSHFGEMSFFMEADHSASVRATSPLECLKIHRSDYQKLLEEDVVAAYKLAVNVVCVLATRLKRMDAWVTRLVCESSSEERISEWSRFRATLFDGTGD